MRGEFIRGDGLVLPNNITITGAQRILAGTFAPGNGLLGPFGLGLCNGVYTPNMTTNDLDYDSRLQFFVPLPAVDWTLGVVNGEAFAESPPVIFAAAPYNKDVTRLFLGRELTANVYALSSPFPAPVRITIATPTAERTFRYRLYLR